MFDQWGEFYLLVGSAAAVLIGLIFVVISLMQDRSRSTVLTGSRLYMGPIVLGVSFVLVLSAAALAPGIDNRQFAAVTAVVALWGLARAIMSSIGIARLKEVHWTDFWFYGAAPTGIYLALAAIAVAFWQDCECSRVGVAVVITAMLLLAIRNEWDLITWIAPRSSQDEELK
jgi:hypothetical protein